VLFSNALLYLSSFLLLFACNEIKNNLSTFTCNEVIFWPFSVLLLRYLVGEAAALQVNLLIRPYDRTHKCD